MPYVDNAQNKRERLNVLNLLSKRLIAENIKRQHIIQSEFWLGFYDDIHHACCQRLCYAVQLIRYFCPHIVMRPLGIGAASASGRHDSPFSLAGSRRLNDSSSVKCGYAALRVDKGVEQAVNRIPLRIRYLYLGLEIGQAIGSILICNSQGSSKGLTFQCGSLVNANSQIDTLGVGILTRQIGREQDCGESRRNQHKKPFSSAVQNPHKSLSTPSG